MNHSAVADAFRSDHEQSGGTTAACLQASLQLRRRLHRRRGVDDEQVLLAVCHLLDALARSTAEAPVPAAVERAARRLAEQLDRSEARATARGEA